jgi:glycosyltransferase involved in cell wall biosynthesis
METIKVLAITSPNSGSHYHRLEYPFKKINGTELDGKKFDITIKEFTPEILKEAEEYNVLAYHWNLNVSIQELATLQAKGVKLLYSLDDFWQFSDNHPYYSNPITVQIAQNNTLKNLIMADAVMVTTERLAIQCMKYNDNIAIIPNFLDPTDFNIEKTTSDKLRVGIIGSISHAPDWKLLKGAINRIAKNKKLVENCEFYVCGFSEADRNWQEVLKLFTVKKNLKVIVKNGLPVDQYMELYKDLDVCLMPLEYTEFNVCKSALKLAECTITKTLPVGSVIYSVKELKGIAVAETPLEYEQTLLELLDKQYYQNALDHIVKANTEDADFEKRIHNTKATLLAVALEDLAPKLDNVKIHSIVYDNEKQVVEYTPYDNSGIRTKEEKSWRFEYNPIIDIVSKGGDPETYLGIFSWKFLSKTAVSKSILYKTLNMQKYNDYDFIGLSRRYWKSPKEYLEFSFSHHPKLEVLLNRVLDHLGKSEYHKEEYVYSNFFLMKTKYWVDYVENWIKPALEFMENDPEYFENANYSTGLDPVKLKELTGLDYYTYHTFVLERLILYYIADKKLKVKSLI